MAQYAEFDKMFGTDKIDDGYILLKKKVTGGERNVEILWRLAQFCHEKAARTSVKADRKALIFEGKEYAEEAHKLDKKSFAAVKWAAVMTGQCTQHLGTKEKIEVGAKFKSLLDEALLVQPRDYTLLHLRGRFSFSVANLNWIERKAAALFYATPPEATLEDALTDFLTAYQILPEWIENLVYIGKVYIAMKDKPSAKKYLSEAVKLAPESDAEREFAAEAQQLLNKC